MKHRSALPAQIGVAGLYIYFWIKSDFISAIPSTTLLSIPFMINLCLSVAIDRPSAHILNNISGGIYLLFLTAILSTVSYTGDWYFPLMVLMGTPLGPLLVLLFPILWITTWVKRDSEHCQ